MRAWLAMIAGIAAGCSRAPASGPADASTEGPPSDASIAPADASAPIDAGGEADDGAPIAPAKTWCDAELAHIFCDDFENAPLEQGWEGVDVQTGALTLDGAAFTSPIESLLATTPALAPGAAATAQIRKRITDEVYLIDLAFDVRLDALDPDGAPARVASIALANAAGALIATVNVLASTSGASVEDFEASLDGGAPYDVSRPLPGLDAGAWRRVAIDVALPLDGGAGTLSVAIDGAPAIDHAALGPRAQPAFPFLVLGLATQGPSAAAAIRFDDVILDYH